MQIDYLRIVLALFVCLGLGVGALFFLRRRGHIIGPRSIRGLARLESLQLDTRTCAHVLTYEGDRWLLVARDNALSLTPLGPARESPEQSEVIRGPAS